LSNKSCSQKDDNNNIISKNKTIQGIVKNNKDLKLNIIQLPNKKISKNIGLKKKKINNNNKLVTIKNGMKNNNYKIINNKVINIKNNSKKKTVNSCNKNLKKVNNSLPKRKPVKLSPSPIRYDVLGKGAFPRFLISIEILVLFDFKSSNFVLILFFDNINFTL